MKHPPDKAKIPPMGNKTKGQVKPLMTISPATLPQPQPLMEVKKPTFEPMTIPNEVEDSIPSKGKILLVYVEVNH